ncbi:FadR/GntR family transcriptional regulator [Gordonia sp. (in: high G+C Gram-positive bacteria)]|uniref:FadR/GntR family transcriptional regulator n=1 Tax=unclassified Gordonia (in: high G+C Gram-positive bacteria) TaxID=2657482 RepID=UPI00260B9FD9|nr:FCD domain-containing protein [Gordonia sp. (in: high G+C Gram-positive bacteria)]
MREVKRGTLIAQVTEQLREEIARGRWVVGQRIPTEPELCEMTGTARNTVREAVQSLVHAGLLERRQGSGTYVVARDEREVAFGGFFAAARRRDLLELREALEVTAAGLAAERRSDADVAELRRLLALRNRDWPEQEPPVDWPAAVETDARLHRAIVAASHNAVYLEFYDSLLPALREVIVHQAGGAGPSNTAAHELLVDAVIARDAGAARTAASVLINADA